MSRSSRVLTGLLLFLAGTLAGGAAVLGWQQLQRSPSSMLQATLMLPTVDNAGRRFDDAEWRDALQLLTREFGGATLGDEHEGWWHDSQESLRREPVREVVVTFERERLPAFRDAVARVGRRLGQVAVYVRLEDVHVEVLRIPENTRTEP